VKGGVPIKEEISEGGATALSKVLPVFIGGVFCHTSMPGVTMVLKGELRKWWGGKEEKRGRAPVLQKARGRGSFRDYLVGGKH